MYTEAEAYGFSVSKDYELYNLQTIQVESRKYVERDETNYATEFVYALLRNKKNTNLYSFIYRITTSPCQVRHWGFFGIGSYGDDWYTRTVDTKIQFNNSYTIVNYAPQPTSSTVSGSIGVGLDTSGPSISASVDFSCDSLTVDARTKSANNLYQTTYYMSGYDDVAENDYYSYGMVIFKSTTAPTITAEFNVQYEGFWWYGTTDTGKVSYSATI